MVVISVLTKRERRIAKSKQQNRAPTNSVLPTRYTKVPTKRYVWVTTLQCRMPSAILNVKQQSNDWTNNGRLIYVKTSFRYGNSDDPPYSYILLILQIKDFCCHQQIP